MAENAEHHGQLLELSAAERAVLEMVACAVDRKVDLCDCYRAAEDDKVRIRLSTEIRLTESSIAKLLRQINTDLPVPSSRISQKASHAARARWDRGTS